MSHEENTAPVDEQLEIVKENERARQKSLRVTVLIECALMIVAMMGIVGYRFYIAEKSIAEAIVASMSVVIIGFFAHRAYYMLNNKIIAGYVKKIQDARDPSLPLKKKKTKIGLFLLLALVMLPLMFLTNGWLVYGMSGVIAMCFALIYRFGKPENN